MADFRIHSTSAQSAAPLCWLVSWLMLVLPGCAAIPIQEMSDARQAIASAEAAGAPLAVPTVYRAAVRLLADAEADLAARDYDAARDAAGRAKGLAQRARRLAGEFRRVERELERSAAGGAPAAAETLLRRARAAFAAGDDGAAEAWLLRAGEQLDAVAQQADTGQAQRSTTEAGIEMHSFGAGGQR